jgi:hypothetical protein
VTVPVLVGAATLDSNVLVDSLVPDVIDGLREELHPAFGVRAYRVWRVIRTWSGETEGEGTSTDDAAELRPQPRVKIWDGIRWEQAVCGIRELGEIRLTEVSLTYTEGQLTGQPLGKNQACFFAIGEAHGQGSETRLFGHTRPPFVDRERDMGWVLFLRVIAEAPSWAP